VGSPSQACVQPQVRGFHLCYVMLVDRNSMDTPSMGTEDCMLVDIVESLDMDLVDSKVVGSRRKLNLIVVLTSW